MSMKIQTRPEKTELPNSLSLSNDIILPNASLRHLEVQHSPMMVDLSICFGLIRVVLGSVDPGRYVSNFNPSVGLNSTS